MKQGGSITRDMARQKKVNIFACPFWATCTPVLLAWSYFELAQWSNEPWKVLSTLVHHAKSQWNLLVTLIGNLLAPDYQTLLMCMLVKHHVNKLFYRPRIWLYWLHTNHAVTFTNTYHSFSKPQIPELCKKMQQWPCRSYEILMHKSMWLLKWSPRQNTIKNWYKHCLGITDSTIVGLEVTEFFTNLSS